jgi:cell division protein FtsB
MAKKRRSSQFKDTSQVIDIEEARRKRQEKRQKQQKHRDLQEQLTQQKRAARSRVKAGRRKKVMTYAVVILCIIAAIGASIWNIIVLKADYNEAKAVNQQLTEEKNALKEQLENSDKDKFIEDEARLQLRMVKPGETVYIVPEQPTEKKSSEQNKDKKE